MIDLAKIKRQPTTGRIIIECLLNMPQLLLILYGLACIATQHGKMFLGVRGAMFKSLHLVPVNGSVAAVVGWEYVGFGLFVYFSDGSPPDENRPWLWRCGRGLVRWGALASRSSVLWMLRNRVSGTYFTTTGFPPYLIAKIVAFIAGFIALISFLSAMYMREQVKRDLDGRNSRPLHIWWLPQAYWVPWASFWSATGFRVVSTNQAGLIHRGYCFAYRSFLKDSRLGNLRVKWLTDTVTGQSPAPEV